MSHTDAEIPPQAGASQADTPPAPANIAEAWERIEKGDYAEAAALLEGDGSPEARHILGYAYVGLGRDDDARALYRTLLEEAGAQAEAYRHLHQLGMVEREAGDSGAALELFEEEKQMLHESGAGALEHAVNGYELAVNLHAVGKRREAHAALAEAFAQAQAAGDPMTLGCLWRAAGDFARAEGLVENAHDAYTNARNAFAETEDERAITEIEQRLTDIGK